MLDNFTTIFTTDVFVICQGELLMIQRSMEKKAFPGFWLVPGGHIELGEDPGSCAIRELKEETGIKISASDLHLTYIAMHRHLDRAEDYYVFAFKVLLRNKPATLTHTTEGILKWIKIAQLSQMANIFAPVKYYFPHVLKDENKTLFNRSEWKNAKLIRILSEIKIK